MVNLTNIKVAISAKQWPGNNSTNRINYSGGAELEFGLGFDEGEVKIDMETFEADMTRVVTDIVGVVFRQAEASVMEARDVMVLPVMPSPTQPTIDGVPTQDLVVDETPKPQGSSLLCKAKKPDWEASGLSETEFLHK